MLKKWFVAPEVPKEFQNKFPELPPVVLQLLYNRGLVTQEQIDEFLNPDYGQDLHDPFLFKDMKRAVARIRQAIEKGEKIVVHGDYDADGVCSAALMMVTLKILGAWAEVYIPHRELEGYGLNKEAIEALVKNGAKLIITVDCGISNKNEIALAKDLGAEIIITDHHRPPSEIPDKALAIINPHLADENYPFKRLAGVGVAFKMAQALLNKPSTHSARSGNNILSPEQGHQPELKGIRSEKWLLDLAAIGTVADCEPLLGENRTLVKYGLIVLNKTPRPGIQKLIETARLKKPLDTYNISFQIAPRLNAAGRMDHANAAYELLTTESNEEAFKLAGLLEQTNQDRQQTTELIVQEVREQLGEIGNRKILFALGKDWPLGLVGLVSGKITDEHHIPSIIMTKRNGVIEGSARSIPEFDIIAALQTMPHFFEKYGGHPGACGFTLKSEQQLEDFKKAVSYAAEKELRDKELVSTLDIDLEVELEEVDWELFEVLVKFSPFGKDNPRPRYLARNLKVEGLQPVGQDGKHLRLMVSHKTTSLRKMIGFCLNDETRYGANWCETLKVGDRIDAVFEIDVNEWNGNRELQMKIVDLRR